MTLPVSNLPTQWHLARPQCHAASNSVCVPNMFITPKRDPRAPSSSPWRPPAWALSLSVPYSGYFTWTEARTLWPHGCLSLGTMSLRFVVL